MKHLFKLWAALSVAVLASCASIQDWHKGENLLQPLPVPGDDWQFKRLVNDLAKMKMSRWSKKVGSGSEALQVIIAHGQRNSDVETTKHEVDKQGKNRCDTYSTDILNKTTQNNYNTISWKTKCKLRGKDTEVVILHKAISGEDSYYKIQKIWRDSFTKEGFRVWDDYVRRIKLCNSRGTLHPCPDGFNIVH